MCVEFTNLLDAIQVILALAHIISNLLEVNNILIHTKILIMNEMGTAWLIIVTINLYLSMPVGIGCGLGPIILYTLMSISYIKLKRYVYYRKTDSDFTKV